METAALVDCLPLWSAPAHASRPARETRVAQTDEALMSRYRDGDDEAFRQLYSRHRASLLRFARHLCHHPAEAEEIFQETWIAVIRARARYRAQAAFVTWLFSIAHRRAVDAHRKRLRRPADTGSSTLEQLPADSAAADPPRQAIADARELALRSAIARLPFEQREVFLLRAEAGLGLRDIASITRARPEAAKSRLRYALRALRKAMEAWA
jgi:RNA polymerase sigma-70 factor (ECF subfamily)